MGWMGNIWKVTNIINKIIHNEFVIIFLFCFICSACGISKEELTEKLLLSTNPDKTNVYANKVRELGVDGVNIFLTVISVSIDMQADVTTYGRLTICYRNLNEMAKEGIYTEESVPVLFNVLENQMGLVDSLINAETLEIITGVRVGYDKNFVHSYTLSDEPARKKMIMKWKNMWEESKNK